MLNLSLKKYIQELVEAYPQIASIWLFGSRANNSAHANSDWDILIFGSQNILESLGYDRRFRQSSIDILIVYDSENFEDPWDEWKSGSLNDWAWKNEDPNTATYLASKRIYHVDGNEEFKRKVTKCNAIRVFPCS